MNKKKILERMKLEDKIALCSGADFWRTKEFTRYGIPEMMMTDGPHGLRKMESAQGEIGLTKAVPATCFPTAVTTGSSWDPELLQAVGQAIAREAAAEKVGMVLGPGVNIKRNPLCGRNFEYFSEDPLLAGRMGGGLIRGIESTGISACVKHFAGNNQEYKRFSSDSIMDERTLREIYLPAFEIAIKEGRPSAVMCAYNKLNGVHCSDSKKLLTDILRKEWGFRGTVLTDWGAMHNRILGFVAGCDMAMPGGSAFMERETARAVRTGRLPVRFINRSTARVLSLVEKGTDAISKAGAVDWDAHYALAKKAAVSGAVLLKNEGDILPLASRENVLFVGSMASRMRYQGSGSSHIDPKKVTEVCQAAPDIPRAAGCLEDGSTNEVLLAELKEKAEKADRVVVFAGLPDAAESEGFDRENMALPEGMNRMIETAAGACENTVVVLMCGSPVELPWEPMVKSILLLGLAGEAGGEAAVDMLFGKEVPGGKLAETWPVRYQDCVSSSFYADGHRNGEYREGLYVGYRYYSSAGVPVRYAFGHGLSYTRFEYSDLIVKGSAVTCTVTNVGEREGSEVVQLYVEPPKGEYYRPVRSLQAFRKVNLKPGESQQITFLLGERSFSVYVPGKGFVVPEGIYFVHLGGASDDLPLTGKILKASQEEMLQAAERMRASEMAGIENDPVSDEILPKIEKATSVGSPDVLPKLRRRIRSKQKKVRRVPDWYFKPVGAPSFRDFERLLGHAVSETRLCKGRYNMDSTLMDMQEDSLVARLIYKAVQRKLLKQYGDPNDPNYRMSLMCTVDCAMFTMRINGQMKNYYVEGLLEAVNGHYLKALKRIRQKA